MPIKRPHKKSRYGCDRCRKRRVKCDEKRPSCSICTDRVEPCNYSRLPRPSPSSSPRTKRSNPASPLSQQVSACTAISTPETKSESAQSCYEGTSPPEDSPNPITRLRELQLMHYWSTRTYKSFMNKVGDHLRDHIVQEALKHDYLLAAMLALTSLHMAAESTCRTTIAQNVDEALHYQNRAVVGLRNTLGALSPENCDAVFITSLIVMVCTIVSPLLQSKSPHTQSTAEAMLGMSEFMKGITSILDVSRPWIRDSPVGCILEAGYNLTSAPIFLPLGTIRRRLDEQTLPERKDGIAHAVSVLEHAVLAGRYAVPWIARVKPEFLAALRDGDAVALAVFMHWGVLLDQLDELWWARFAGRLLVEEVACTLDESGGGWDEVTMWCRRQVGLCE